MSFKDQSWGSRFALLGDQAERAFSQTYPQGFVKFGLDRPPVSLKEVPAFVRYTPDFLTAKGLVEVQGFGRDRTLKLKADKLEALHAWEDITDWRVDLYVFDSHESQYAWVRLADLEDPDVAALATTGMFDETKLYYAWHVAVLPINGGWQRYDAEDYQ